MQPTVGVAYYPEGAGHATRMVAVAQALERRGAAVSLAGGGDGSRFVELNGYDEFEPTPVDYIDTYQDGALRHTLTRSLPASVARVRDYVGWLRDTDPDALVTDDMFAAVAAARVDTPLYVLKHDMPELYSDPVERAGAALHTEFQLATAREFFVPAVPRGGEVVPERATRVPPVALEARGDPDPSLDVLCVPSHFSSFDRLADRLERAGYDVVNVGDDDWTPVPSLLPYVRAADAVVCSGYSTIMDAAVAGTPCLVRPATDEQAAVAAWLQEAAVTGFTVVEDDEVPTAVTDPPAPPAFENGAHEIAAGVLDTLGRDLDAERPGREDRHLERASANRPAVVR